MTLFLGDLKLMNLLVQKLVGDNCTQTAQQCVGADGREAVGESSSLPAAAQLHR